VNFLEGEMNRIYTRPFAAYYDMRAELLTQNTDQELEFFRFVFDSSARIKVRVILDVGCGTGRHYIPLMQEGYDVTGLDGSQSMLNVLKEKAKEANVKPCVLRKDMRDMDFASEFDAIICMNTVFLYLLKDEDIFQAFSAFHKALKPGGAAIIDIMNFLSLLGRYKEDIVKIYSKDGVKIERAVKHSVEDVPAIWNHHEFGVIEDSGETITYLELHRFRMLNYNEMCRFLNEAGFNEIRCFGEFTAREEVKTNSKRLIFVAVK
jgi:SAM-dependent methyltransferase